MLLSEISTKFVFKTKIDLGDGDYIVLREPNQKETIGLSDDANKNLKLFGDILENCIVESSFVDEEGKPAKAQAIAEELKKSGSLWTEILTAWLNEVPFQSRLKNAQNSGK